MPPQAAHATPTILQDIKQSKPFPTKSQEAYVALLRTADDAKRFVSLVLEPEDVTLQQYNVLRILRGAGRGGLPTLAVAERMIERTPGVTRLIDRMERKKWVVRERCTEDRRRVWCRITQDGLDLLDRLNEPMVAVDEALAGALGPEELVTLLGYLDRVRAHMSAIGG
jgi:DNA-binding MarR family transcriptional regulator